MNIACVTAHPDDAEILCAGTMIKYVRKGHKVTFVIATNGEVGSPTLPREEIARIRRGEAEDGARIVGADLIWLGYPDEFLFDTRETRLAFINALRACRADVIFTHYPDYYNCDHNTVHKIANDVSLHLAIRNITTERPPTKSSPYTYFMDTIMGKGFEPEEYVDITDVFEQKKEALLAHKSQYTWLKEFSSVDYADMMETQAKFRGYQAGVKYAEAFTGVKTYPRVTARSFLPQYL
jgi:LmbE family N-acetylglucosaminyl deacetylase